MTGWTDVLTLKPPPVTVLFSPQPPLNLFGLPARYASALYTAACASSAVFASVAACAVTVKVNISVSVSTQAIPENRVYRLEGER